MTARELPNDRCKAVIEEIARKENFKNFEYSAAEGCSKGNNFLGEVYRIVITGTKNGDTQHSLSLILKIALKNPNLTENGFMQSIYKREAFVYTKLLPTLNECQINLTEDEKFEFPKLYNVTLEESDQILVLEDMRPKGYQMPERMELLDYQQLVACIKNAARYHATSFVLKAKQPTVYKEFCEKLNDFHHLKEALLHTILGNVSSVRALVKDEPYESAVVEILNNLSSEYENLYDVSLTNSYDVLSHGDLTNGNLLFKVKNATVDKMIFIDWQQIRNASPIVDLSYILILAIDSKMRTKYYHEMLDLYYNILSYNMSKMGIDISNYYPREIYDYQINIFMKFSLFVSFVALPVHLSEAAEEIELSDMLNVSREIKFSKACCDRMKELFKDCIEYKII